MSHNKLHGRAGTFLGEPPAPSPHPLFDIEWYSHLNPDIPANELTLDHYLSEGWRGLKSPHPLISIEYYFQKNPDIKFAGLEPLTHFVTKGWLEERNPHPLFDVKFYCSQISGFHLFKVDPLTHYVTIGWKQGLRPNKIFDPDWYLRSNADVKEFGQEPLTHYLRVGWKENSSPNTFIRSRGLPPVPRPFRTDQSIGGLCSAWPAANFFVRLEQHGCPPVADGCQAHKPRGIGPRTADWHFRSPVL